MIDGTTDLDIAARRVVHTKFFNNGQTCISPDYVLVAKGIKDEFLEKVKSTIGTFYGENPAESGALCGMVNEFHTQRVLEYLKDCGG